MERSAADNAMLPDADRGNLNEATIPDSKTFRPYNVEPNRFENSDVLGGV